MEALKMYAEAITAAMGVAGTADNEWEARVSRGGIVTGKG